MRPLSLWAFTLGSPYPNFRKNQSRNLDMDGLRDIATRDISKSTFGRAPASISYVFSVTVVKVLHFIDGVKWYVGRF